MKLNEKQIESVMERIIEMKAEIPQKAATDPEFHDALKANPQATIEKFYGLPEGLLKEIDIRIFEEAPASIGIVIPPPASTDESELTEEQLEAVAGGAGFSVSTAVFVAATVVSKLSPLTSQLVRHGVRNSGWGGGN